MDGVWVYLKDKVDCRRRLSDVVWLPENVVKSRSSAPKKGDSRGEKSIQVESPVPPGHHVIFHRNYTRKRYYVWVYLKGKVDCRRRLSDAVWLPEKAIKSRSSAPKKRDSRGEEYIQVESPVTPGHGVIFHRNYTRKRYYELGVGDSSRNITEMIFRAAATNASRDCTKIERILKVKHSSEVLERFEKVRKKVCKQLQRHPRCDVDGNELLQFYGTHMNCCSQKLNKVSELCKDFTCQACRIIQSGFNTEYGKYGIPLTSCSTASSGNTPAIYKGANVKRAVMICRIIAGVVVNFVDREREGYDSIRVGGLYSTSEYLIVRNSSAVLPCFVIVYS